MAELPEFLSLTNHQSDDLFCLPFNISLQRGQRPTIFLAESIKEKRQCQMGDPVEIECENQPPVYEGPSILWIECVPNNGQGTLLVAPRLIRQALPCTDKSACRKLRSQLRWDHEAICEQCQANVKQIRNVLKTKVVEATGVGLSTHLEKNHLTEK
jgi:hypothetical protein